VGKHVTVHNPGGDLEVDLGEDTVLLTGPAEFVARVEIAS
jgi:diaminopimelate epimerase